MTETTIAIGQARLELVLGDITEQHVDAIANAANGALRGGGGVDGAIHRAAGPGLLAELRERHPDGTPTGTAVATGAPRPSGAVGAPRGRPDLAGRDRTARPSCWPAAYRSCLVLADELGATSIAFPAISMGIYGYPPHPAARIALDTVVEHLRAPTGIGLVRFVLFSEETFERFADALAERPA